MCVSRGFRYLHIAVFTGGITLIGRRVRNTILGSSITYFVGGTGCSEIRSGDRKSEVLLQRVVNRDAIDIPLAVRLCHIDLGYMVSEPGLMIIPVGEEDSQQLQFIYKENGQVITRRRELCRFVPLVSDANDQQLR